MLSCMLARVSSAIRPLAQAPRLFNAATGTMSTDPKDKAEVSELRAKAALSFGSTAKAGEHQLAVAKLPAELYSYALRALDGDIAHPEDGGGKAEAGSKRPRSGRSAHRELTITSLREGLSLPHAQLLPLLRQVVNGEVKPSEFSARAKDFVRTGFGIRQLFTRSRNR